MSTDPKHRQRPMKTCELCHAPMPESSDASGFCTKCGLGGVNFQPAPSCDAAVTEEDVKLAREFVKDINNPMANYPAEVERAAQILANHRAKAVREMLEFRGWAKGTAQFEAAGIIAERDRLKADNAQHQAELGRLRAEVEEMKEQKFKATCAFSEWVARTEKAEAALAAAIRERDEAREELRAWRKSWDLKQAELTAALAAREGTEESNRSKSAKIHELEQRLDNMHRRAELAEKRIDKLIKLVGAALPFLEDWEYGGRDYGDAITTIKQIIKEHSES